MKYNYMDKVLETSTTFTFDTSVEMLLQHSKNKTKFRKDPFLTSTGGVDISDYTSKGIKRSRFAQKNLMEQNLLILQRLVQTFMIAISITVNSKMQTFRSVLF